MATPTQPRPTRTSARRGRRTLVAATLAGAAAFVTLPVATSSADPRPTIAQVQRQVDALNARVDVIVEEYANSRLALAAATHRAAVAQARVAAAQAQLDAVRSAMSSVAAAAYRNGGTDEFVSLVNTASPQTFLDRAGALDRIAAGQSAQLAAAATARHRLQAVQADAAAARAAQDAVSRQMAQQQRSITAALDEETRLLNSLKAEERARLEAARQAAVARAAARASRSRAAAPAAVGSGASYTGPASGRASVAVQAAYAQLGKPYQWGASGPGSFDCSGLTMWAWGKAGVSLSHSAEAQYGEGQHVSQSATQPGDLVFFGSPIHHVGIYVGGGNMISAPHTGDVVKVQPAFRSDYVGSARP